MLMIQGLDGLLDEVRRLRAVRARVVEAFAAHHISCDCMGVTHDASCPLGELEREALARWERDPGRGQEGARQ